MQDVFLSREAKLNIEAAMVGESRGEWEKDKGDAMR